MQAKHDALNTPYHQAGIADSAILCDECEPKFTGWDTYGFEVLASTSWSSIEPFRSSTDNSPMAIPLATVDYERLSLFILSVLWRASVSTDPFYAEVSLRPCKRRGFVTCS